MAQGDSGVVQDVSGWFRMVQGYSGWFRVVQGGSGWFRVGQGGSGWFRVVKGLIWSKIWIHPGVPIPACSN